MRVTSAVMDGLIVAALRRRLDRRDRLWREAIDAVASPAEKLLALFDAVSICRGRYTPGRGCAFLATGTELPGLDHPVQAVITAESTLLLTRLNRLARTVATDDPATQTDDVLLVYDEAMAGRRRGEEGKVMHRGTAYAPPSSSRRE
ncbi:hypothetical protein ACIO3R_24900 [Streptomyces sp. NPDC087428]|uniref:hypothetical protein n=1 Tax=Streptomyces sp. NPDC087428 TaxID=3365788 RepID=UPI003823DD26